jgi:hypothetical protein
MVLCYKFVAKARGTPSEMFARLPTGASVFTARETCQRHRNRVNKAQLLKAALNEQPVDTIWRAMLSHPICDEIFAAFFSGSLKLELPRFAMLRQVQFYSTLSHFKDVYGNDAAWEDNGRRIREKFICKLSLSKNVASKLFVKLIGPGSNQKFLKGTPHPPCCAWFALRLQPGVSCVRLQPGVSWVVHRKPLRTDGASRVASFVVAPVTRPLCPLPGWPEDIPIVFASANNLNLKCDTMTIDARNTAHAFYDEVVAHFSSVTVLKKVDALLKSFRTFLEKADTSATMPVYTVPAVVSSAFPGQPTEVLSHAAFYAPDVPTTLSYQFTQGPVDHRNRAPRASSSGPTR